MSKSVNAKPEVEVSEQTLDAQVTQATSLATTVFNHALNWPNASSLAAVDRAIGLLQSFMPNALILKVAGRPAVHDRLTALLLDITMGRFKLGAIPSSHSASQLTDTQNTAAMRAKEQARLKKQIEDDAAAFEARQKEFRKLL